MTDYYSVLSRAIGEAGSNTPEARTAVYQRVQGELADRFKFSHPPWTVSRMQSELTSFEAAVNLIEAEMTLTSSAKTDERLQLRRPARCADAPGVAEHQSPQQKHRIRTPVLLGVLAVAATAVGAITYLYWTGASKRPVAHESATRAKALPDLPIVQAGDLAIDAEELPPGVDGGSAQTDLAYSNRRQPIYYRTTYSAGMIIIDRSQRFLYLVQPQSIALRYGIGVGGECSTHVGLQRISKIAEWPEWVPSPDLRKRKSYPARIAGGPGNPLGARLLYFEHDAIGIHGTNAPRSIGQAVSLGCYRMVNDAIVDLAQRVAPDAGVVVMH